MCESIRTGTNWRLFARLFTSWVFTLIVASALSALFFAQGGMGRSGIGVSAGGPLRRFQGDR